MFARATAADGSVLLCVPIAPMSIYPHFYPSLGFDPVADFAPVSQGATFEFALAVARNEHAAGRFFPYVALTHQIPGDVDDDKHVAVLGVLAQGEPEKNRNVNLIPVRLELKIRKTASGFVVLSARSHLGR